MACDESPDACELRYSWSHHPGATDPTRFASSTAEAFLPAACSVLSAREPSPTPYLAICTHAGEGGAVQEYVDRGDAQHSREHAQSLKCVNAGRRRCTGKAGTRASDGCRWGVLRFDFHPFSTHVGVRRRREGRRYGGAACPFTFYLLFLAPGTRRHRANRCWRLPKAGRRWHAVKGATDCSWSARPRRPIWTPEPQHGCNSNLRK